MEKNNSLLRLKKVLLNDKINMPNGLLVIIKKDIENVLSSYFEFDKKTLKIEVDIDSSGKYDVYASAKAERIKTPKFIN